MTVRRILVVLAACIPSLAAVAGTGVPLAQGQAPANPIDGWKYPGATQLGSGSGGGGIFMVLATTDGLEKVAAFYGKKVGKKLTADRPGGMGLRGGDGQVEVFQDDSIQPGATSEQRPVVVRIFVQQTRDHFLTLVITRGKGEDQTHVSLTYIAK